MDLPVRDATGLWSGPRAWAANFRWLMANHPWYNDTDADLDALRGFIATLRHVEKTEICPYHPLGIEKYAKFGRTPPFPLHEPASASDTARWGILFGT